MEKNSHSRSSGVGSGRCFFFCRVMLCFAFRSFILKEEYLDCFGLELEGVDSDAPWEGSERCSLKEADPVEEEGFSRSLRKAFHS